MDPLSAGIGALGGIAGTIIDAHQEGVNRDFNSAEAQKNRDWQEEMSNTAIQRKMADAKKAGLNPILAMGEQGAGTGSGGQANAPAHNAIKNPFETLATDISAIKKQTAEKQNIEAQTSKTQAETDEIIARTPTHGTTAEKNKAETKKITQEVIKMKNEVEKMQIEIKEKKQEIENLKANKEFTKAQTEEKNLDIMNYNLKMQNEYLKNAGLTNPMGMATYFKIYGIEPYRKKKYNSAESVKKSHLLGGANATIRAR